jgi:hypothetical protein
MQTIAASLSLAVILRRQREYREAESLLLIARAANQRSLDENHADIQRIGNRLAVVLIHQEEYERAKALCLDVIASSQKLLGFGHQCALDARKSLEVVTEFLRGDDTQRGDSPTP